MTRQFSYLLPMSENSNTEYKSSFSDAVIETLVAFANTKGGQIFIGLNADGEPVKNFVVREETVQQWLNEIKHKTQPSAIPDSELIEVEGKEIIALSIKEFPVKPVSFRGRYFKRVQNSNHQLNLSEISDMHLKTFNITGNPQREERWEYPLNAIREIIINMVVHRDYMHYGDSSVKVFDHHIEFFNPGALPQSISIEQLLSGDYTSQARNKKVSSIFKEAGVIEKYGSGIKRIQNAFLNYGLEAPVFENFQHGFRVIVSTQTVQKTVQKTVEKTVEKTDELILNLIKSDSRITTKAIQQRTGLSRRGIEWQIQKLKDQKIINRIGPDKGGHWEIIKDE